MDMEAAAAGFGPAAVITSASGEDSVVVTSSRVIPVMMPSVISVSFIVAAVSLILFLSSWPFRAPAPGAATVTAPVAEAVAVVVVVVDSVVGISLAPLLLNWVTAG